MVNTINETEILERLNDASSVRGYFIAAVEIFSDAITALMERIFRKDNFAVQSVVGPLLHDTGPLGNRSVRLKLLYGLGVVADDVYHDIECFIKIRNQLNKDGSEYTFTDPNIVAQIKELNLVKKSGMVPFDAMDPDLDIDLDFYHLQLQRQQQMIKSGLSLAIIEICNDLNKESPF
ncbi:MltR family transcriptional regulator [Vibrio plantisponsor]|uniref:MltR family transcriptional regulator n=1 Tax=Vibrio plantisponsor TaxID=664643 RepID=A0ABU4INN2_9VIBR|nr:MltR family transcriptional regulator [Vibrio plantisponsor]MDW6019699.1 MltR family transcriptional regulator [Vibrio plantisponsor]NNM38971.1 MltR family transcriptional regulator [Vibrio plantisponsor]